MALMALSYVRNILWQNLYSSIESIYTFVLERLPKFKDTCLLSLVSNCKEFKVKWGYFSQKHNFDLHTEIFGGQDH